MPASAPNPTSAPARQSWLASLSFWACLLVALALYASVALAPKLRTYFDLRSDYQAGQVQLVTLERRTQYLERVVQALEHDREFASELARIDFDASRPGDERIAVAPNLSLDGGLVSDSVARPAETLAWHAPVLAVLATHDSVRQSLLLAAAVIAIIAFTFLQDASPIPHPVAVTASPSVDREPPPPPARSRSLFGLLADRYRKRPR